jgi:hypothetical protein
MIFLSRLCDTAYCICFTLGIKMEYNGFSCMRERLDDEEIGITKQTLTSYLLGFFSVSGPTDNHTFYIGASSSHSPYDWIHLYSS